MDSRNEDRVDESSPLLQVPRPKSSSGRTVNEVFRDHLAWLKDCKNRAAVHWVHWKVCYICGIFVILIDFGSFLCVPAVLRMLEAAVCRRYYMEHSTLLLHGNDDVPEPYCKLDPIQEELSFIQGWAGALEATVGVIFAMPWGVLADKKGRRFVAVIGISGLLLSQAWQYLVCYFYNAFSPRAMLARSLFTVIGGGTTVIVGIMIGVIADAATPEIRAQVLFYLQAAVLIAQFCGVPVGATLLKKYGYWTPALVGLLVEAFSCVFLYWMPTISKRAHHHIAGGTEEIAEANGGRRYEDSDENDLDTTSHKSSLPKRLLAKIKSESSSFFHVIELVLTNRNLCLGFIAMAANNAGIPIMTFLPQFASKRFGWTIGDASLLTSLQALISIFHLLVLLPILTRFLKSRLQVSGPPLDLRLSRLSIPFLTFGTLLMFLITSSPGLFICALVVFVLGSGFRASMESYLASLVKREEMATLYVAVSVFDTIGQGISSPGFALFFGIGLKKGEHGHRGGGGGGDGDGDGDGNGNGIRTDLWLGLPFLFVSSLYGLSWIMSAFLRVKPPKPSGMEDRTESGSIGTGGGIDVDVDADVERSVQAPGQEQEQEPEQRQIQRQREREPLSHGC